MLFKTPDSVEFVTEKLKPPEGDEMFIAAPQCGKLRGKLLFAAAPLLLLLLLLFPGEIRILRV